jgi:hypothetical protein
VFAVSGLKLRYRLVLRGRLEAKYIDQEDWLKHVKPINHSTNEAIEQAMHMFMLHAPFDVLLERIKKRSNHFFPSQLLQSQFDALELPVDQSADPVQIVDVRMGKEQIIELMVQTINGPVKKSIKQSNDKLVEEAVQDTKEQAKRSDNETKN